jgi:hypothetical protein
MRDNGAVIASTALPSRYAGLPRRIPRSLADLAGPAHGTVRPPTRLVWSGPTEFDIDNPGQRLTLYRTLIDCGQRDDFIAYVNADLLVQDWPVIRRLTGRRIVEIWEASLPDLANAR